MLEYAIFLAIVIGGLTSLFLLSVILISVITESLGGADKRKSESKPVDYGSYYD